MNTAPREDSRGTTLETVVQRLSKASSLAEVMRITTRTARLLMQADGITFVLRDGDLCWYAEEDAISPLWRGRRFPIVSCISGWCITRGVPAVIPDVYADARIPADAYRPTFVQSLAMVPLGRPPAPGAMGAYWAQQRTITGAEVTLLQTIADAAAAGIERHPWHIPSALA